MAKRVKLQVFPCVIFSLSPENNPEDWKRGYRYRVHDFDDEVWRFATEDRMYHVLAIHSMMPVLPAKMAELRNSNTRSQPWVKPKKK
jgi:hypothetical protein